MAAVDAKQHGQGGLGNFLKVSYAFEGCEQCETIQVVQVFYALAIEGEIDVSWKFLLWGSQWSGFVDGGKNMPNVKAGHQQARVEGLPYYYAENDLRKRLIFRQGRGLGSILVLDHPDAVKTHKECYFETALVCVNVDGKGDDRIFKVLRWGWKEHGCQYFPSPESKMPTSYEPEVVQSVSEAFKQVVNHDYPGYRYA